MPLTLTAQNAFDAVLKFGSVFGAYAVPGSILQTSLSPGNLLKYSVYATLSGNGASLAAKICPVSEGECTCDRETADKIRAFLIRWVAGSLPFCIYVWNSDEASVFKIIGASFPFLFAFEVASELLSHYIRCCPERVIVQRMASRSFSSSNNSGATIPYIQGSEELMVSFSNANDGEDGPSGNSEGQSVVLRDKTLRPESPEPGSEDFNRDQAFEKI